jgi:hypothetical protein
MSSSHSPYRPSYSQSSHINAFPFFEPFSEHPSPAPISQSHYSSPPAPSRRTEPSRAQLPEWHQPQQQQQFPTPAEWLRPNETTTAEYNSGIVGHEEPLRSSFTYQPTAHEVRRSTFNSTLDAVLICALYKSCTSPLTFSPFFTRRPHPPITSSLNVLSSLRTNKRLFFFSRSSRLPTLTNEQKLSMLYALEVLK